MEPIRQNKNTAAVNGHLISPETSWFRLGGRSVSPHVYIKR